LTGNPQATIGVRADRIAMLMEGAVGGPNIGPMALPPVPPLARLDLGSQADFPLVGNAPERVRQGINAFQAAFLGPGVLPLIFPSAELIGLCSLLLSYTQRGLVGQVFAKQIAPVMARTDFVGIFNDLPWMERLFLSAGGAINFNAMWTQILATAAVPGGIGAQLFAVEPGAVAGLGLGISTQLTRQAWLTGIATGNDVLTPGNFPFALPLPPGVPDPIFGLGGMGGVHDPAPPGGGPDRPILELRRMPHGVSTHNFTEIAMGIFDYVVALNGPPAAVAYARVPRVPRAVKNIQRLGYFLAGGH
jgi:hypothetical protein